MPKRIIKRYTPDHETIRSHKYLRIFGTLLHDSNLWHMNRRSVSGAIAVGIFWAFVPMPFQMIPSAATAIVTRVNLPISVAMVWISNPITMPPLFYFTYRVGTWILGEQPQHINHEMSVEWMVQSLEHIWQPLYLGSLLCGIIASILGYTIMRIFWRWHVVSTLRKRRAQKKSGD